MSFIKKSEKQEPFTLDSLRSGKVGVGSYLMTIAGDLKDPTSGSTIFKDAKLYKVLTIVSRAGTPVGVTLDSELGGWVIHFENESGGAHLFAAVELSPDEELGMLEGLPEQILRIFTLYPGKSLKRNSIIDEILFKHPTTDAKERAQLRTHIAEALNLLEKSGHISRGDVLGTYYLAPKGIKMLKGE